mmetsp:Transcript_27763/g.24568  ORF Transcript_27763/g.24568 Transcript_27763/m.24568 type:complete len:138 (-) Transcript_27763:95-508(-)
MAQEGKEQDVVQQYSLVVSTINNNDLRISCNNDEAIKSFQDWYTKLTNGDGKVKDGKAKYTKAIILDSARKEKFFGEYDWDQIVIDYMFTQGFTLAGDGNSIKISSGDYARQQTKLIFLSPKPGNASINKPPAYTMQ